jgi:hypothetical protein
MRRREFIAFIGGAATAFALPAHAQQPGAMRHVGLLMNLSEADPAAQPLVATFREGLNRLGWVEGGNLNIDYRWSAGDVERIRKYAAELVALDPDVILAYGGSVVWPLLQLTHSVPIVFTEVVDPAAPGLLQASPIPAAMPRAFPLSTSASAENGWSFSNKFRPESRKSLCLSNRVHPALPVRCEQSIGSTFLRCGDQVSRSARARRDRASHGHRAGSKRRRDCNGESAFDSQS